MTRRDERVTRSLSRRLVASYALLVGLLAVTGVGGLAGVHMAARTADRVVGSLQPARSANQEALTALTMAQGAVTEYALSGDPARLQDLPRQQAEWSTSLRRIRQSGTDTPYLLLRTQEVSGRRWLELHGDPFRRAVERGSGLDAARAGYDQVLAQEYFDRYRAANADVERWLSDEMRAVQDQGAEVRRLILFLLLVTTATSLVFGVVAAWSTTRHLVRPLASLRETVRRMTAGDSRARADVSRGPVEVIAVGEALNALADEHERNLSGDQHREWMRRLAHDVGLRIRDGLDAETVARTAVEELGSAFGVDRVILRLVRGDRLAPVSAEWHETDIPPPPRRALECLASDDSTRWPAALWASGDVFSLADPDVSRDAPVNDLLRRFAEADGARALLVVPVGAGAELLGTLMLEQLGHARPWTPAETGAVQAIAADLGRSLRQALLYEQERLVVDQLRALDRSKTDFLSTVSHELRTPLTSITGYVELLRFGDAGPVGEEQVRMLDVIDRSAGRLRALIEDLLTLSRIEAGALRSRTELVEIRGLVQSAIATVEPSAAEAGVCLDVDLDEERIGIQGDPGQLDRVLLNLLSNAVKFSRPGGRVSVRTRMVGDEVTIEVTDTGIGIPEAEQDKLFTRFFRATNATDRAIKGTGLGLTIVRSIVEQHEGSLSVTSVEGAGTTVHVRLPGRPGTGPGAAAPEPAADGPRTGREHERPPARL